MILKEIIELYLESRKFNTLSPRTKKDYLRHIKTFNQRFGKYSALKMSKLSFQAELEDFIDRMKEKPRNQSYFLAVIKSFGTWASKREFLDNKQIKNITIKKIKPQNTHNWTEKNIDYVMRTFPRPMKNFVMWAVETGLRRCDLIRLKHENIRNINERPHICIEQSKTKNMVYIAMSKSLIEYYENMSKKSDYILTTQRNKQWIENNFNSNWKRAIKNAQLQELKPHGLRKVTVRRLVEAGATIPQISATLGWTLDSVNRMLQDHYFIDKRSVSHIGIDKLDAKRESPDLIKYNLSDPNDPMVHALDFMKNWMLQHQQGTPPIF